MTQATKTRLVSIFLAFVLGICAVITTAAQTPLVARAESITYSGVMEDLKKDTSFNPGNYPTKADDYSLQIIQLAESVNKELFVYVYQPSGKAKNFKASSINISTTINDSISYLNYKLELLNSNVRYSWGISGILNQNSVNSEFVKWRPRISRSPFFAFFMWNYFPLQGNITIFANITPKNNLPFRSTFIYLINRYFF